ncbi:crossover junction endodeoxyribonuclease RuvC [Brucepastera parasyntrophica]|uniref:crossover junction endodeoxyribonuclease RuvC n=1 Tax=Brucepastera parasyntrophica TaxID=2880008 RepID=UPI00210B90C6|nr:crossover junction endodeoxyribonuclease RuvC [Brucepastera parasyntrophica]ULQ60099.1 crossover junction endodeoxyribonuclease RuvC [Brucepastera parasyntrophica]
MINKTERIVIGIDPGLASTGYGIVRASSNHLQYIAHGVIETTPAFARQDRIVKIFNEINEVLDRYKPDEAGMETLFFAKNVSSAMGVAEARGVVTLALGLRGIKLGEYTPNGIKQAVAGITRANKKQVQEAVCFLLGLCETPEPDHAADALAAAITRIHTSDFSIL